MVRQVVRGAKRWLLAAFILAALAVVSVRVILLTPGTVGHNWDWSIPPTNGFLRYSLSTALQTWSEAGFGAPRPLTLSELPYWELLGVPIRLGWNGGRASKALLLFVPIIAGFTMYGCARSILTEQDAPTPPRSLSIDTSAFLAALSYAFCPFLFSEYIGGAATQFVAHAIVPLPLWLFVRAYRAHRWSVDAVLCAVSLVIVAMSLQDLVLTCVLIGLVILTRPNPIRYALRLLAPMGVLTGSLSAYWLFPIVEQIRSTVAQVRSAGANQAAELTNLRFAVPSTVDTFLRSGYFRPFYEPSVAPAWHGAWLLASFGLIVFVVAANTVLWPTPWGLRWTGIFLGTAAVSAVGRGPIAPVMLWLYTHVGFMTLFRSPQHLLLLPAVSFSLALACAIRAIPAPPRAVRTGARIGILGALAALLTIASQPFWSGDLGIKALRSYYHHAPGNFLDVFRLSPGYKRVLRLLESDTSLTRVAFLPANASPLYLHTPYQYQAQGGDPLFFGPHPGVDGDFATGAGKDLVNTIDAQICTGNIRDLSWLWHAAAVRWIVVRRDVRPLFSGCPKTWNVNDVIKRLNTVPWLRPVFNEDEVVVYEDLRAGSFLSLSTDTIPSSTIPPDVGRQNDSASATWRATVVPPTAVTLPPTASHQVRLGDVRRLQSTRYIAEIYGATQPALLVFAQSFDPNWQASIVYDNKIRQLPPSSHLRVNGYANGWILPTIPTHYEIVLEYAPQRAIGAGFLASGIGLVVGVLVTLLNAARLRSPPPRH